MMCLHLVSLHSTFTFSSSSSRSDAIRMRVLVAFAAPPKLNVCGIWEKISQRFGQQSQSEHGDIRKDIKIITREDVHNNMMHFLLMQWLRKDASLTLFVNCQH